MRLWILLALLTAAVALVGCGSQSTGSPEDEAAMMAETEEDESLPPRLRDGAPYEPKENVDTPILEEAPDLELSEQAPPQQEGASQTSEELLAEAERLLARSEAEGMEEGAEPMAGEEEESARYAALVPSRSPYQSIEGLVPIHFGFDEDTISAEAREILDRNAQWILEHADVGVRVEGHCDERGTPAYNLALGQRRANRVRNYLISKGIPPQRLLAVSFGEEVPVAFGHDESAWRLNRRVEFSYLEEDYSESTSQTMPRTASQLPPQ